MDAALVARINETENESDDFKSSFDPTAPQYWCELIKDIVAMANSGGGIIVIGVNDDGSPAAINLQHVMASDPVIIVDKFKKYTDQHVAGFCLYCATRRGYPVAAISVSPVRIPIVFTAPGTYDVGGGKQKTAFSKGTVYFRHGAKSEPVRRRSESGDRPRSSDRIPSRGSMESRRL